jgi:hypothetical protein
MVDEFIHWPKPYLLLSATCDELLSWMIEIWINNHLVQQLTVIATLEIYSLPENLQGMINIVGLTFSVGDTTPRFTNSIEQDN